MIDGNLNDCLVPPTRDGLVFMPALHSGGGRANFSGHRADTAEFLKDAEVAHEVRLSHNIAHSQVRQSPFSPSALYRTQYAMETTEIIGALKRLGVRHDDIAEALGKERSVATKLLAGTRALKATEVPALLKLIAEAERNSGEDMPGNDDRDYLAVEVLPSFAGMGGGGSGEGDAGVGLVPRRLVEDELRAKPSDMLLIDVRGDSMEPDFQHGDQILIDRRDTDPLQPGSFALWDGDGYVVKLVERVPQRRGWYRIFSANGRYSPYEVDAEEIRIMGRPVWFARRL